jgi:hypothetical protein
MMGEEARQALDDPGRRESEAERADRNMSELLQELRVAGIGVQVLFGFLLSLPFTVRFHLLSANQRGVYLCSLLLATLATALLSVPVAYHRLAFRRHEKNRILATSNVMALLGLAMVGLALSAAVLLVTSFVDHGISGPIISAVTALTIFALWFVLPMLRRRQDETAPGQPRPGPANTPRGPGRKPVEGSPTPG